MHVSRARCRAKSQQTWVCQKCEVKVSQLRRGFGSWPVAGFTKISRENQQAFFRDAKDMNAKDFVKKAEEMLNISEDIEAQFYQNGGKFLPLDVWMRKGYNAEAIKTKSAPDDIREHPVLGTTYRLKILELGDRGEKRNVARHILSGQSKEKQQQTLAAGETVAGDEAAAAQENEDAAGASDAGDSKKSNIDSSESDDSSGSSSSSSSGKKKKKSKKDRKSKKKSKKDKNARKDKKAKKDKSAKKNASKKEQKEKKEKEKAEKKALAEKEKVEKKAHDQKTKLAQNLLSKMESTVSALTATLERPESMMLAEHLKKTGEGALAELKQIQMRCRCVIAAPQNSQDELMSQKELNVKLGHAKRIDSLMEGICKGAH